MVMLRNRQASKRQKTQNGHSSPIYSDADEDWAPEAGENGTQSGKRKSREPGVSDMLKSCIDAGLVVPGQCGSVSLRICKGCMLQQDVYLNDSSQLVMDQPLAPGAKQYFNCNLINYVTQELFPQLPLHQNATDKRCSPTGKRSIYDGVGMVYELIQNPSLCRKLKLNDIIKLQDELVGWRPRLSPHFSRNEAYAHDAVQRFISSSTAEEDTAAASQSPLPEAAEPLTYENVGVNEELLLSYNLQYSGSTQDSALHQLVDPEEHQAMVQDLLSTNTKFSFEEEDDDADDDDELEIQLIVDEEQMEKLVQQQREEEQRRQADAPLEEITNFPCYAPLPSPETENAADFLASLIVAK